MAEFILEIGSEEIPAGYIQPALNALKASFEKEFSSLEIAHGDIKTFGTPRRIGCIIADLPEKQEDRVEKVLGPKVDICFDTDGNPTKVANGFAKGQGVDVADLERVEGPKGLCVQATKEIKGRIVSEILSETLATILPKLPWPKSMRWSNLDQAFVRPLHWIVAALDGSVVPFEFANVKSGNKSFGHRFMHTDPIPVSNGEKFLDDLEAAFVIPEIAKRQKFVLEQARELAEKEGGILYDSPDLVAEVANLIEYPVPLVGSFEEAFLEVPKQVLIDSMVQHQKYFPILDKQGNLLPRFILFANTQVKDPKVVIAGNERVLRARLSDGRFFFEEDRKKKLADFAPGLDNVTFEERLGTIGEKVDRIKEHVRYLASFVEGSALEDSLRAAELCKADLLTNVVYEFPDLQGIMGSIYAKADGESEAVYTAIEQHYWPRFADDNVPTDHAAAIIALADKMDTVVGCFGVGLKPTGGADPYALRRQALGILRILADGGYRVPLRDWIEFAVKTVESKLTCQQDETIADVFAFFEARYRYWRANEFKNDTIDAVVSAAFDQLPDVEARIKALDSFRKAAEFEALAIAFKRVMNILKDRTSTVVSPNLFDHDSEHQLWNQFQRTRDAAGVLMREDNYLAALEGMAELKPLVDKFFDDVLVMAEDQAVRENRLALLGHLADLFSNIADFRKIQTEQ